MITKRVCGSTSRRPICHNVLTDNYVVCTSIYSFIFSLFVTRITTTYLWGLIYVYQLQGYYSSCQCRIWLFPHRCLFTCSGHIICQFRFLFPILCCHSYLLCSLTILPVVNKPHNIIRKRPKEGFMLKLYYTKY